jgi:hypothetical protein
MNEGYKEKQIRLNAAMIITKEVRENRNASKYSEHGTHYNNAVVRQPPGLFGAQLDGE